MIATFFGGMVAFFAKFASLDIFLLAVGSLVVYGMIALLNQIIRG